jgi:hypothetical protein
MWLAREIATARHQPQAEKRFCTGETWGLVIKKGTAEPGEIWNDDSMDFISHFLSNRIPMSDWGIESHIEQSRPGDGKVCPIFLATVLIGIQFLKGPLLAGLYKINKYRFPHKIVEGGTIRELSHSIKNREQSTVVRSNDFFLLCDKRHGLF